VKPLERILKQLKGAKASQQGWVALCPGHDDRNPSLSVSEGQDDQVLLRCHAGCTQESVVEALGLKMADLFAQSEQGAPRARPVATYDYCDEEGAVLFQVVRLAPKGFFQQRPDGKGGWAWTLGDVRRVLYRLPRVLAASKAGEVIFVVEGEKDVHALESLGLVATTNAGGAGKWRPAYARVCGDPRTP
jgi:putative DNA primase/helicase